MKNHCSETLQCISRMILQALRRQRPLKSSEMATTKQAAQLKVAFWTVFCAVQSFGWVSSSTGKHLSTQRRSGLKAEIPGCRLDRVKASAPMFVGPQNGGWSNHPLRAYAWHLLVLLGFGPVEAEGLCRKGFGLTLQFLARHW